MLKIVPIIIFFGLVVGVSVAFGIQRQKNTQKQGDNDAVSLPGQQIIEEIIQKPTPSPTPFLFQDLTIPYLQNRNYQSSLNVLNQIGDNSQYTSYIARYDSDGLNINGLLTIPNNDEKKHPAIIFIHGYIPPAQYRTKVNYVNYVDYFAKNGFVVFKIDLRGHDQSEGEASGAYYSGDYIIDTLNAYAALQTADFVDPNRIGLWGHSMAGNVVFRSLVAKKNIPAVIIWSGAVYTYEDMRSYGIDDGSYQPPPQNTERARKRQQLRELYGDFDANHWFWKQVVPANYLQGVSGSLQIHHAVNDSVVSVEYSRNLMNILDSSSIQHELVEYQSGGHNLTGSSFTQAMQKSVEFFREKM